jgi:virginiamycin A acetyltransferase
MKTLANLLTAIVACPAAVTYWCGARLLGAERVFPGWSQALSLVPGLGGVYLRRAWYRWVLTNCGEGACITFGTILSHATARIGTNVYVGAYCVLGDVTLEDDVLIGSQVSIINGSAQHGTDRLDLPVREQPGIFPRVTIGRDTWIGERAVVMADIGRHCVVAAGAVVTRPVPDFAVVAGVPAKVVRYRNAVTASFSRVFDEQDTAAPTDDSQFAGQVPPSK